MKERSDFGEHTSMMSFKRAAAAAVGALFTALAVAARPPVLQPSPQPSQPDTGPGGTSIYDSLRLDPPEQSPLRDRLGQPGKKHIVATGKRYALLLGVGEAEWNGVKQSPLPQCRLDVAALSAALAACGYECTVLSDTGSPGVRPATVAGFDTALKELISKAGPDDQVLVYLSSHGGFADGQSWVIAADGAISVLSTKMTLSDSRALVRILMMDCCRGDKSFGTLSIEPRDVHTILACRPDELSATGPNGLSIFTEALIDAITDCRADRIRDGRLELDEVVYYLDVEVPRRAKRYAPPGDDSTQNPTRVVVDPKSINPIIATCGLLSLRIEQPTAYAGPPLPAARNDWILSSLSIPKIREGMTPEQMKQAMGKDPAQPLTLDDHGSGATLYEDGPRAGDALLVFFEKGVVARVSILFASLCEGDYDASRTRAAVEKELKGAPVVDLFASIDGLSVKEVQERLGCAADALIAPDGQGNGQLRYPDVPRLSQTLFIEITDGKASGVRLEAQNP